MAILFDMIAQIASPQMSSSGQIAATAVACPSELRQATKSLNEARFIAMVIAVYALVAMASIITALRILR